MERNEILERRLQDAPDDLDTYAIYGDWLTERGDPRGELVAVQLALARAPTHDPALAWQEAHLLRRDAEHLLGPLAPSTRRVQSKFRFGFLDRLTVTDAGGTEGHDVVAQLTAALASATGNLVRALGLSFEIFRGPHDVTRPLAAIAATGPHRTVRALALDAGLARNGAISGDVGPIWEAFPSLTRLEVATLNGVGCGYEPMTANLEELTLINAWEMSSALPRFLLRGLPRLQTLCLERSVPDMAIDRLLASRTTPCLRTLRIRDVGVHGLAYEIVMSPLLEQLDELDLAGGALDDDDAEMLARRGGARLGRLGRLDVSDNTLSRDGVELLRRVCPNLVADGQRTDEDALSE